MVDVAFKAEKKQTSCAYCGVGCGLDIELHNGIPIKLVGAKTHPANQGRICVKGTNLLDTIGCEGRLLEPKIDDKAVSWSQATDHVANKFSQIISKYGKDALAFYVSGQLLTEDYYVANKLMKGYIGSANIDTNSRLCMSSAVAGYKRAFGEDVVPCNYDDLECADVIFFIGSNAAWTHPVLFQRMQAAKIANPNLTFVALDPRTTATSNLADLHLPLTPGSDSGFYNGLLHYLIEQNHLDQTYIDNATSGFEASKQQVKPWTISTVSRYCGVAPDLLLKAYKLFATQKKVVSFYSMGINQSNSGVDKCNAIINCHLATGKIAKPGCGPFSITGQPNAMGGREIGGLSNQLCAHLDIDKVEDQQLLQSFWQSPTMIKQQGASATEIIEHIEQGKIKAIWIMATNPVVSLPDRERVVAALKKCELVVVSDCVEYNDTLEFADVKLPASTWLEKDGTVTNSERVISRQRGMINPIGQAKHDWQIICDIAKGMGFSGFEYQHPQQIFSEFCQLTGVENSGKRLFDISTIRPETVEQYDELKPTQWPISAQARPFSDQKFSTLDQKARFIAISPILPELQDSEQRPFILNSGRIRDQWHTMTRTSKSTRLTQHSNVPKLTINPADALDKGLQNNDWVKVSSSCGDVILEVHVSADVKPRHCFMPIHWNQQFASNANTSSLFSTLVDPLSKQPQFKQVAVNYEKVEFDFFSQIHLVHDLGDKIEPTTLQVYRKTQNQYHQSYFNVQHLPLNEQPIQQTLKTIKQSLGLDIQWLSLLSGDNAMGRLVGTINGKLSVVIECVNISGLEGRKRQEGLKNARQLGQANNQWFDFLFEQDTLKPEDKVALLAAKVANQFLLGKQICSCFNVHQDTIEQAIAKGHNSLLSLAKNIKCGSGCGSCKPEIEGIIARCSLEQDEILAEKQTINKENR